MSCEDEWAKFCLNDEYNSPTIISESSSNIRNPETINIPKPSDVYISTRTKIGYLNMPINISDIFWKIPIIPYSSSTYGIIKKQIKMNFKSNEEWEKSKQKLDTLNIINTYNDLSKNNKIIKKISIGLSKKDLISYRCSPKGAFYNCFVIIIRIKDNNIFKEMHVKIFNTGKIEIPGIKNDILLDLTINKIKEILNPITNSNIIINPSSFETVLINSNFNCGFYIKREKLADLLKYKYKLCTTYDPCSYPGIMSKYYYYNNSNNQGEGVMDLSQEHATIMSFMIFRTGSILIVGRCNETIINIIYNYIINLLESEFTDIFQCLPSENTSIKQKKDKLHKKKLKRKFIYI